MRFSLSTKWGKAQTFRPTRTDYSDQISQDIKSGKKRETLDFAGISDRFVFSSNPGIEVIAKKVREGCSFRMLILHPDSQLLTCIENLSKDFGYSDVKLSIYESIQGRLKSLVEDLQRGQSSLRNGGTFEIRLHKDIFSSLAYYSSSRLTILGLYLSHVSGSSSPTFEIEEEVMRDAARQHFNRLWEKSSDYVLVRLSAKSSINNIEVYFPKR